MQSVLDKIVDGKKVFGASFAIKYKGETWNGAAGNIKGADDQYFIASTTKLFTTALVLNLCSQEKLQLDDPIGQFFEPAVLGGLHVYKGKDYSHTLTVRQLLAHTTGLPDYFQDKGKNGQSLEQELVKGNDQYWTFEQASERCRTMQPLFAPGTKGKAHYSDMNFQLLGKIIEHITQKTYAANCNEMIIKPLGMSRTYLYEDIADTRPKTLYYKDKALHVPKAMTSFRSDGGMVSCSADLLVFVEAFFQGKLFPKSYIDTLQDWNKIFFPFQSGVGFHRFKLPWIFNPFGTVPDLIGHSGLSGALAYYSPKDDLYIAGTVNQVYYPDKSFRTAIKLIQKIRSLLLILAFSLSSAFLFAQTPGLTDFNQKRLQRTEQSMWVLGAWGAANIAVGAVGMSRSSGAGKAFHQMNLGWGAINLGLAASGLWTAMHTDPAAFDLYQTTQEHHKLQKLFLFNAGLDAGYIMAGFWMQEKAKTAAKNADRLRGFGRSIALQGAFLMVFDLGAWWHHHRLEPELKPFFERSEIGFSGNSVQWVYRF